MDGYIKAPHDNGLEFQNGLVKKRPITEEMPCGALDYYRKDAIRGTKLHAVEALQKVMEQYETSKMNIATIVSAFKKEIEKMDERVMDEQELRKMMEFGFEKFRPKIGEMTNLMMDMYQQGFKDCWRLLTGKEF